MKNISKIKSLNCLLNVSYGSENRKYFNSIGRLLFAFVVILLTFEDGKGLPSYARQTGMSCSACHFSFPELNSFGRQFKMNGYVLSGMSSIEAKDDTATRLPG